MSVVGPSTSTVELVIDLLVQKFQALDLTINQQPVAVYDGPEGPDNEDNYIVVMGWPAEGGSAPSQTPWAYLGDRSRYEDYDLAVMVFCYVGGDDSTATFGPEDAQAQARANARTIRAAIETALLADPNLSVQNGGIAPILWILLSQSIYAQTLPDEEQDDGMGRFSQWALRCHVKNVLGGGFTTLA